MTNQEKRLRKMMVDHRVSINEIAEFEQVSSSSVVSNRFKNLTPSSLQRYEDIILQLSRQSASQKAAS